MALKPIRRVVTGNDERGKSKVIWDGPAPDVHLGGPGANSVVDLWIWNESPAPLKAGEIVILRGTNHAWSNRSGNPVMIAIASHDGA